MSFAVFIAQPHLLLFLSHYKMLKTSHFGRIHGGRSGQTEWMIRLTLQVSMPSPYPKYGEIHFKWLVSYSQVVAEGTYLCKYNLLKCALRIAHQQALKEKAHDVLK